MKAENLQIKLAYIAGLQPIVREEVLSHMSSAVCRAEGDFLYFSAPTDLSWVTALRSVLKAYIVVQNPQYNPHYLSRHKSIIGSLIASVIEGRKKLFTSFKLICAGADSDGVRSIAAYIEDTYGLAEEEDADLKVHIIKIGDMWEVGVQLTPRPLSYRDYKVRNMPGAMDPTIAYAVNLLAELNGAKTYLNIFSGSGTLLIEAAQCFPDLEKIVGFDNDKEAISLAMQNIRKAGVIRRVQVKEADIMDVPVLGKYDAITSDLPFGMSIAKHTDLDVLYEQFVRYCEESLTPTGTLVVYTVRHEILKKALQQSKFKIIQTLELELITAFAAQIRPKIFVCKFK